MADVLAVRNEYRLQSWMEIIRECEESGLSNMVLYRKTEMIFADTAETEQTIQEAQGWTFYQKAR